MPFLHILFILLILSNKHYFSHIVVIKCLSHIFDSIYLVYIIGSIYPFCAINILYIKGKAGIYMRRLGVTTAYLLTYLATCLPACLPAYLPACLTACLPACLCQCLIQFGGGVGPIEGSHCLPTCLGPCLITFLAGGL